MPFINTKINVKLTKDERDCIKSKLGKVISSIPGKSENSLMVAFEEEIPLYFRGSDQGKIAFVEVKLFGKTTNSVYDMLTSEICSIYADVLKMSAENIYVKYEEVEHWGWNGNNF